MAVDDRIAFGAFELDRTRRILTCGGRVVPMSYRCLDALVLLADAGGAVVDRAEFAAKLWPDTFVDDSSLPQLLSRLRKTLADYDDTPCIETVPKRGYRMAVPVTLLPAATAEPHDAPHQGQPLPAVGFGRIPRWSAAAILALVLLGLAGLPQLPGRGAAASDDTNLELREARRLWHKRDDDSLRQSQDIVSRVLQRTPESAKAHALLADLIALRGHAGREAGTAATRALAIDGGLADGYASLGFVRMAHEWNWTEAGPLFERAVALDPRLPHAWQWLAVWRVLTGDVEGARAAISRARDLDPLAPHLLAETAGIEYFGQNYPAAIDWARRALAADPHFGYAYSWWAAAARQAGLDDEAFRVRADRITFFQRRPLDAALERSLREGGIQALLAHEIGRLVPTPANAWARSVLHSGLGRTDEALDALHEAVEHRNFLCIYLGADPVFDALRALPAFQTLLVRVGLTPAGATDDVSTPEGRGVTRSE